jgi:hypothetical protein
MPKEQINHPQQVTSDSPQGYTTTSPTLHVGWNRAGWVQVSIATDTSSLARLVEDAQKHGESEPAIYTDELSRDEINRLIRTLRKARDQAYGADA